MEAIQEFGLSVIRALQVYSPSLDGPMAFLSFLGTVNFYLLMMPFIYWVVDRRLGIRVLQILTVALTLDLALKLIFHLPRPYWIGDVQTLAVEPTYGLPSAHAVLSIAIWSYLAYRLRKSWLWIFAMVLVALIGLSRVYVGVHFPHDVVFGWLIGAVILWIFVRGERFLEIWEEQQGLWRQIWTGFGLSLVVVLANQAILALLSGRPDPAQWSAYTSPARSPAPLIGAAGLFVAVVCGYALMKRFADFQSGGVWLRRTGRYVLGIVSVLVINFALGSLIDFVAVDAIAYGLSYIRTAFLGLWILVVAPWLFLRTHLAD
jgi:membrane-associated phospholipid phosphatase